MTYVFVLNLINMRKIFLHMWSAGCCMIIHQTTGLGLHFVVFPLGLNNVFKKIEVHIRWMIKPIKTNITPKEGIPWMTKLTNSFANPYSTPPLPSSSPISTKTISSADSNKEANLSFYLIWVAKQKLIDEKLLHYPQTINKHINPA